MPMVVADIASTETRKTTRRPNRSPRLFRMALPSGETYPSAKTPKAPISEATGSVAGKNCVAISRAKTP